MSNLFIGMLLLFLNFNLNIGNISIGLIPDFLGYIFIVKGVVELSNESQLFVKVKPYASGMIYYSGALYIFNLLGLGASLGFIWYILQLISVLMCLYITYFCVKGIKDMEELNGYDLHGETLYKSWIFLAVLSIISSSIAFLVGFGAIIIIIVNFIAIIMYLVNFNQTKKLYLDITNNRV